MSEGHVFNLTWAIKSFRIGTAIQIKADFPCIRHHLTTNPDTSSYKHSCNAQCLDITNSCEHCGKTRACCLKGHCSNFSYGSCSARRQRPADKASQPSKPE